MNGMTAAGTSTDTGKNKTVGVGILGFGNVGGQLVALIADHGEMIAARAGVGLRVERVAVRNVSMDRPVALREGALTADAAAVVSDPAVDVVVEVIGGIEPARSLILAALEQGKPVVTANKELLANVGTELFEAAERAGVDLLFEGSVAGGIPLIRPLRESLAGEKIRRVTGIVNGTTNFILTRMSEEGSSFADALVEAQSLGYAERDP
ncbi:MAG: homoserine dehydrogenase, partial [Actinomycetota bacterium]|nr:homoserine dehydrogenase [Actinomycetota bacterium]